MRHLPQLGFLCIATLSACKPDCGGVQAFNNFTYRGFANPVIHESNNPAFTEGPEYWSYGSPANGASEWQFKWGGVAQGPVTVVIDGQEFEGTGELDELECGTAVVNFGGIYTDDAVDVEHTFNASMSLNLWVDDNGSQFGGYLIWKESWSHPSSETGSFSAESHVIGELLSQGT